MARRVEVNRVDDSTESFIKLSDTKISNLSFNRWHRQMQAEHALLERTGIASPFSWWKCCYVVFKPCRWFDSIEYNKKIFKCCLTFKTFKNIVTIFLVGVFSYAFMYSLLGNEVLPGGSVFFLFFLFLTAFLVGYIVTLVGMPGMIGHLVTGITYGNVPHYWLPDRDEEFIYHAVKIAEKILVVLALIRSGLLLDLARMKNRLKFIIIMATFPFFFEFLIAWVTSHFLLELEWEWSALQGTTVSMVSLATVTSIMDKNKNQGYGEDKHLSTVLIASAALSVLFGLILYSICLLYIILDLKSETRHFIYWKVLVSLLKQSSIGIAVGIVSGFLIAFFPDKRHSEAAGIRIIVLGLGSFGVSSFLSTMEMTVAGAIACLLLCFICTNMWEELGWHQDSNPVLYFYTRAYYIAQPMVLSLLGYTMHLRESSGNEIGLSLAVVGIALMGREIMCVVILQDKTYPTTNKEKIFVSLAWLTKGTFQALLAFSIMSFIEKQKKDIPPPLLQILKQNCECIKRTTILAILLVTPIACYALTLLTPKLLTTYEETVEDKREPHGSTYGPHSFKKRISMARYQDTVEPTRRTSIRNFSELAISGYRPGRSFKIDPERTIPESVATSSDKSKKNPKTPPKK